MKKTLNIISLLLIVAIIVGDICYIVVGGLLAKSLTSACFVLLGVVCIFKAIKNKTPYKKFCIFLLVGLVFAMLGDILLEVEFIVGAALFAVGHIFFFVSYCFISRFKWKDLIFGTAIFVPSVLLITLAPFFEFGGIIMEIVCVIYAIIISCMVGKAVSNLVETKSLLNIVIVVGSCLFFFSDLMLLLNVFASLPQVVGILCLATYYPAEILLACSIGISACNKKEA